jgi:hypothetical protein
MRNRARHVGNDMCDLEDARVIALALCFTCGAPEPFGCCVDVSARFERPRRFQRQDYAV